jgi:hypothetical protein
MGVPVLLQPVLREDLDAVLAEMRLTEVQIAIPAERITRDLIGGDWAEALDMGKRLTQDGTVRIGMSVGRSGDRDFKERMSLRYHELVNALRTSVGLSELSAARVRGVYRGSSETIDLLEDRLAEQVNVDGDRWSDPDRAIEYARETLLTQIEQGPFGGVQTHGNLPAGTAASSEVRINPSRHRD